MAGHPLMAEPDFGTGKNVVLPFPSAQGRTLSFSAESPVRPGARAPRPGNCLLVRHYCDKHRDLVTRRIDDLMTRHVCFGDWPFRHLTRKAAARGTAQSVTAALREVT